VGRRSDAACAPALQSGAHEGRQSSASGCSESHGLCHRPGRTPTARSSTRYRVVATRRKADAIPADGPTSNSHPMGPGRDRPSVSPARTGASAGRIPSKRTAGPTPTQGDIARLPASCKSLYRLRQRDPSRHAQHRHQRTPATRRPGRPWRAPRVRPAGQHRQRRHLDRPIRRARPARSPTRPHRSLPPAWSQ